MGYDLRDTDKVSITIKGHGYYQTTAEMFDKAMEKYLPASVATLRDVLREASEGEEDFSDLTTVTECLFILSEYDGNNL